MTILFVGGVHDAIQIDGHWHGTPMTVIRLMQAPDTPEDDGAPIYVDASEYPIPLDPTREISLSRMLKERHAAEEFARVGEATLWTLLKSKRGRHVVVTGPEPCWFDLRRLSELLHGSGRQVQVETRGKGTPPPPERVWLTLRPPAVQEGDLQVDDAILQRADEIVARIYRPADVERLDRLMAQRSTPVHVWVIPGGRDKFSFSVCMEAASNRRWRVSRASILALAG